MTTFFTSSNTNLNTVRLVALAVYEQVANDRCEQIDKVVLFSSPETSNTNFFIKQIQIYEQTLGSNIRIEKVSLNNEGLGQHQDFTNVFKIDGRKYVDITNGQKTTTAQLYLAASLLQIENIFYASLNRKPNELPSLPIFGKDYEYVRIPPFTGIEDISRLNYLDLIFYLEEIDEIFTSVDENTFLNKVKKDLRKSIISFFQDNEFRSAISDATTSTEVIILELLKFLKNFSFAQKVGRQFGIQLERQRDPLGAITYFFRVYSEKSGKNISYRDGDLEALMTIPGLLTPLRMFRNFAAHSGASNHIFKSGEARICINLALECFRGARSSHVFWEQLRRR